MRRLTTLFNQVWGTITPLVGVELLRAIEHAGGYVAAAYLDDQVVGGSLGFLGRHDGAPSLHSHITGILPGVRRTGLGRAMKLHQRAWAADHGLTWVTWTFDPLVRRNAWFNIDVLGAQVHEYLVDFYGPIDDAINAGDESDRLLVAWPAVDDGTPTADRRRGDRRRRRRRADARRHRRAAAHRPGRGHGVAPPACAPSSAAGWPPAGASSGSPATASTSWSDGVVSATHPRAAGDPPAARQPVPDQLRRPDEPAHPARAGRGRRRRRDDRGLGRVRRRRRADVLGRVRRRRRAGHAHAC